MLTSVSFASAMPLQPPLAFGNNDSKVPITDSGLFVNFWGSEELMKQVEAEVRNFLGQGGSLPFLVEEIFTYDKETETSGEDITGKCKGSFKKAKFHEADFNYQKIVDIIKKLDYQVKVRIE